MEPTWVLGEVAGACVRGLSLKVQTGVPWPVHCPIARQQQAVPAGRGVCPRQRQVQLGRGSKEVPRMGVTRIGPQKGCGQDLRLVCVQATSLR